MYKQFLGTAGGNGTKGGAESLLLPATIMPPDTSGGIRMKSACHQALLEERLHLTFVIFAQAFVPSVGKKRPFAFKHLMLRPAGDPMGENRGVVRNSTQDIALARD